MSLQCLLDIIGLFYLKCNMLIQFHSSSNKDPEDLSCFKENSEINKLKISVKTVAQTLTATISVYDNENENVHNSHRG